MNIKQSIVAVSTAVAISAAAIAVPGTASAQPFGGMKSAAIETGATAVETVGSRHGRHRRPHHGHRGRHFNNGAAAAIGIGAFALGAALAANAATQRVYCRDVRFERWSPRRQAYVISVERVCE